MEYAILLVIICALIFLAILFFFFRNSAEEEQVYSDVRNPLIMQILVPRENEKASLAAEQMFASIHGILGSNKRGEDVVSFEIISTEKEGIRFFVVAPQHLSRFIEGQIYAQYPNADIEYVKDYTSSSDNEEGKEIYVTSGEIEMEKDSIFPIKTFRNFDVDPLAAITGAMSELNNHEKVWLQIIVRPISNIWQEKSKEYITAIKEGKS